MDPQDPLSQFLSSLESGNTNLDPPKAMLPGLRLLPEKQPVPRQAASQPQPPKDMPRGALQGNKICNFWYHGHCTKSSDDCKFMHQTENSCGELSYRVRPHGPPCGLDLCRYKDPPPPKTNAKTMSQDSSAKAPKTKKRKRRDSKVDATPVDTPIDDEEGKHPRKFPFRHWDKPFFVKQSTIDYDDVPSIGHDTLVGETCFFWYHGHCSREHDAARGLAPPCPFLHELTQPPSMVHLPPKLLHHGPDCDKEWCPMSKAATQKQKYGSSSSGKQLAPGTSNTHGKESSSRKPKHGQVDETCFFWYHGRCARAMDRSGCSFKHGLTDPPSMVQPPPGYKHREPCNRDWCPGDAPENMSLNADRPLGQVPMIVGANETPTNTTDGKDEWYLEGFD